MQSNEVYEPRAEVITRLAKTAAEYKGDFRVLESAIGAYFLGQSFGWKTLYMVHGHRTLKRYSDILGFTTLEEFRGTMYFEGPHTKRMYVFRVIKSVTDFWKVITNSEPVLSMAESRRKSDIVS